jgi:hypothetical protein
MDVNFIITCYDKESYWEHLKSIIESYTIIKPHIALCYNGLDETFKSDFKCEYKPNGGRGNDRHPSGCDYADADYELTMGGYDVLKNNGVRLWVKLSIDSWLLDEKKIIKILNNLISEDCAYGGSIWYEKYNMSTDIFFANTMNDNIFEDLKIYGVEFFDYLYSQPNPQGFEFLMTFMSKQYNRLIINQRKLLHNGLGHRWSCPELGWTMSHNLNENILFKEKYIPNNNLVTFSKIKGTNVQYSLENSKNEI